jgi:hypothetical protein
VRAFKHGDPHIAALVEGQCGSGPGRTAANDGNIK